MSCLCLSMPLLSKLYHCVLDIACGYVILYRYKVWSHLYLRWMFCFHVLNLYLSWLSHVTLVLWSYFHFLAHWIIFCWARSAYMYHCQVFSGIAWNYFHWLPPFMWRYSAYAVSVVSLGPMVSRKMFFCGLCSACWYWPVLSYWVCSCSFWTVAFVCIYRYWSGCLHVCMLVDIFSPLIC